MTAGARLRAKAKAYHDARAAALNARILMQVNECLRIADQAAEKGLYEAKYHSNGDIDAEARLICASLVKEEVEANVLLNDQQKPILENNSLAFSDCRCLVLRWPLPEPGAAASPQA